MAQWSATVLFLHVCRRPATAVKPGGRNIVRDAKYRIESRMEKILFSLLSRVRLF
jgi:hypothetical protein